MPTSAQQVYERDTDTTVSPLPTIPSGPTTTSTAQPSSAGPSGDTLPVTGFEALGLLAAALVAALVAWALRHASRR